MNRNIQKQFNRIITYNKNGYTFYKGEYYKDLYWNEKISRDGYYYSQINIDTNLKTKYNVLQLNNWINYCNKNNVDDIFIYMKNPNIRVLNNYLQNVGSANEELNIRHLSINYSDTLSNFYNENHKDNTKNKIYGLRKISLISYYVDKYNYNIDKIFNIINFSKSNDLKFSMVYNNIDILKDKSLEYNFNKIYNININILDFDNNNIIISEINNKIEYFDKLLRLYYKNNFNKFYKDYTLNIYIEWNHFIHDEYIINKLNSNIKKLMNIYEFRFNIFIPEFIKYLIKDKLIYLKYY